LKFSWVHIFLGHPVLGIEHDAGELNMKGIFQSSMSCKVNL